MPPEICPNPDCRSTHVKILETRIVPSNGGRRRRYGCQVCPARWTVHDGEPPSRGGRAHDLFVRPQKPPLTEEEAREILIAGLTTGASGASLARQFNRTRSAITAILRGDFHRNVCPELVRRSRRRRYADGSPTCRQCANAPRGTCLMGFPEAILEGEQFAADCSAFISKTDPDLSHC